MKKISLILYAITTCCLLFSEEIDSLSNKESDPFILSSEEKINDYKKNIAEQKKSLAPLNKGFFYVKSGATSGVLQTDPNFLLGFGYRSKLFNRFFSNSTLKNLAFDMNTQLSRKQYNTYFAQEVYFPKINGLYFLTPEKEKSVYLGSGFFMTTSDPAMLQAKKDSIAHGIKEGNIYRSKDFFMGNGITFILGYDSSLHKKYMNCFQGEINIPLDPSEGYAFKNDYTDHWTINFSYLLGY